MVNIVIAIGIATATTLLRMPLVTKPQPSSESSLLRAPDRERFVLNILSDFQNSSSKVGSYNGRKVKTKTRGDATNAARQHKKANTNNADEKNI